MLEIIERVAIKEGTTTISKVMIKGGNNRGKSNDRSVTIKIGLKQRDKQLKKE